MERFQSKNVLAIRDIGSVSGAFSLVISQRTSSEFVDFLKEGVFVWVAQIVRIIDFRFF